MKSKLGLVVLALLVVGLASQAFAWQPIACTRCSSTEYTHTKYMCPECGSFDYACESWNGQLFPRWLDVCPECGYKGLIPPYLCLCGNPICVGGSFWP